jgi:sugar/nucleoside kinase (ribokinase family)
MSGQVSEPLDAVLVGRLQREYLLPYNRPPRLNVLGGNLAYAAGGVALWNARAGLLTRVDKEFPINWLEPFTRVDFDIAGVRTGDERIDDRRFVAYSDPSTAHHENPLTWFAERQLPFPRELLGYNLGPTRLCSKTDYQPYSLRINDVPRAYLEVSAAHICPIDFLSHKMLPSLLKAGMIQTLSMRACACYMDPSYWGEMKALLSDVTAFLVTETEALKLFQGRSVDLWEIAEALAGYGPEFVLIDVRDGSRWVHDRVSKRRWIVPAYPTEPVDITGAAHAFDGGFLINLRKHYDVIEGTLRGQVSAAFCAEGSGPTYLLDALPGLKEARVDILRARVMAV